MVGGTAVIGHDGSIAFTRSSTAYNYSGGKISSHVWRNLNIWDRVSPSTYKKEPQYMNQSHNIWYFIDHIYNTWQQKLLKWCIPHALHDQQPHLTIRYNFNLHSFSLQQHFSLVTNWHDHDHKRKQIFISAVARYHILCNKLFLTLRVAQQNISKSFTIMNSFLLFAYDVYFYQS